MDTTMPVVSAYVHIKEKNPFCGSELERSAALDD